MTRLQAIDAATKAINAAFHLRHDVAGFPIPSHKVRTAKRAAIRQLIAKLRTFRAAVRAA